MKTTTLLKPENSFSPEQTDIDKLKKVFSLSNIDYQDIGNNTNINSLTKKWSLLADSADIAFRR